MYSTKERNDQKVNYHDRIHELLDIKMNWIVIIKIIDRPCRHFFYPIWCVLSHFVSNPFKNNVLIILWLFVCLSKWMHMGNEQRITEQYLNIRWNRTNFPKQYSLLNSLCAVHVCKTNVIHYIMLITSINKINIGPFSTIPNNYDFAYNPNFSRLCHDCWLRTEWWCLIDGWQTVVFLVKK